MGFMGEFISTILKKNAIFQLKMVIYFQRYFLFLLYLLNCSYLLCIIIKNYDQYNSNQVLVIIIMTPIIIILAFLNDFINLRKNQKHILSFLLIGLSLEYHLQALQEIDCALSSLQFSYFIITIIKEHYLIQNSNLQILQIIIIVFYMISRILICQIKDQSIYCKIILCIFTPFIGFQRQIQNTAEPIKVGGEQIISNSNIQNLTPLKNSEIQHISKKQAQKLKNKMTINTSTNKNQNQADLSFNKYLSTYMVNQEETKNKDIGFEGLILAQSILQSIQTGIIMVNNSFKIEFCNQEMKKFFQVQDKQSILENLMEIKLKGQQNIQNYAQFSNNNKTIIHSNSYQDLRQNNKDNVSSINNTNNNEQSQFKKKNATTCSYSTTSQIRKLSTDKHRTISFQKSAHRNTLIQNPTKDNQNKLTSFDAQNNNRKKESSLSSNNFVQPKETEEKHNLFKNNQLSNFKNLENGQEDLTISFSNLSQMGLKQGKLQEFQHALQTNEFQIRTDNANFDKNYSNISEYNFKKCIIPQKVLQIFEQEDVYMGDLIKVIFEQQDRAYFNNCYSQNDLHENFNKFDSFDNKVKTEGLLKSYKALDQNQKQTTDQQNERCISYYIDKNNLVVNLKQSYQYEVKYIQIRIGFYIQKQNFEWNTQSFVIIEIFDLDQLTLNLQEQEISDYKNRMLASVSHELRTPLNCSIQMLNMLFDKFNQHSSSYSNQEIVEINQSLVKPALISNQLLINIINDILDYAQINAGYFKLVFASFSLLEIVTECAELMHFQATQKGLTFDLFFDSNLPEFINSDQNRIRQVLLNLLSNSLKFTDKGNIEIRVTSLNSNLIKIDVKDTGCGIPQDNLNKIFESFGNKQNSKFLNTQGAGLGLSVANNLAMGLGGNKKIEVKSKVNEGTCFSFYILNRESHKQGCEIKLKDIFNKRLVKWESINENTLLKTMSFTTQKNFQQQQLIVRNNPTNGLKNQSKTDNLDRSSSLSSNKLRSSVNYVNSELQQEFISFSMRPSQVIQSSNESANNYRVFPSFLGFTQAFSNLNNDISSPHNKTSNFNHAIFKNIRTQESFTQQNSLHNNNNNNQQQQQQPNILFTQQQPSIFSLNIKNKPVKSVNKTLSINENQYSFEQSDTSERQITKPQVIQDQSLNKNIDHSNQIISESCQIQEDQQVNKNQVQDQLIFNASKNQNFDQIENLQSDEYFNFINQNLNPITINDNFAQQDNVQNSHISDSSTQLENTKISSQIVKEIMSKRDTFNNRIDKGKQNESLSKQKDQQSNSNKQPDIATKIKAIQWKCQCPKILIVDDNDFNLYTIQIRLQQYAISVDKASSGLIAIDKCKQMYISNNCCQKYVAILMDIDMPIKDGHQTTKEIIEFFNSYNIKIPLISACSAFVQESEKKKALQSGMQFYITKPIQTSQLELFLEKAFSDYF
ncbi:hypothetical protein ABPG74_021171 [Tetrahymena malaccensis]